MASSTRPRGFVPAWNPQAHTRRLLGQVRQVLHEYADHLPLTVRQIFYRLVATCGYPKDEKAYGRLVEMLVMARRAQQLEFAHIRDDGAPLPQFVGFDSPGQFLDVVRDQARRLHLDRQARTESFIVVMCEAAGMVPQLERVAGAFSVPVLGSGGFASLTFAYGLAQWVTSLRRPVEVLHITDLDPSGVHIHRALAADVAAFAGHLGGRASFSRLAVTQDQALAWRLPTAPAKVKDRRSFEGVGEDPTATVQAEAIPPDMLADLVLEALEARIPRTVLVRTQVEEVAARRKLAAGFDRLLPPPDDASA